VTPATFEQWIATHTPPMRLGSRDHHNARAAWDVGFKSDHATFEAWAALAFPWLLPPGADYRNLKAAFEAGRKAGQEAR